MSKLLGKLGDGIDSVSDQIDNRSVPQVNPIEFLKDWVQNELPDRIVDLAVGVAGDASALPTKKALDAADDPEFGGPVGAVIRENASKILPGL